MIKTITAEIKAAGPDDGLAELQFEGYASVFGNKDSYGDVVTKGAFKETLATWKASGNELPCLWSHDMNDPESNIGHVLEAKEDEHGLRVKVQLDPESAKAATVYRLLKGRRVSQMSFAYEVLDAAAQKSEELGDYYELKKLKLFEVSVVPIGANQETEILAVKLAENLAHMKAGRTLSAKNETALRTAYDALGSVLSQLDDSEKASASRPDNAAKAAEDPASAASVVSLAALEALELDSALTLTYQGDQA